MHPSDHNAAGATIEGVYFAVPTHYTTGDEHPTLADAFNAARLEAAAARDANPGALIPNKVTVDVRWVLRHPDGSTTDVVVDRQTARAVEYRAVVARFPFHSWTAADAARKGADADTGDTHVVVYEVVDHATGTGEWLVVLP